MIAGKDNPVCILGGGPAGAAAGCYLAKAGIPCLIFERDIFPRPHVGESLVPSTTRIFNELDFLKVMEREGFVRKYGASWHPTKRRADLSIKFSEIPQDGVDQDYTYHVDRGKFDMLLLKHAQNLGAKVHQGVNVKQVCFEDGRVCGVDIQMAGQTVHIPCHLVLDATGRNTLLGRQLRIKQNDPNFNQFVVHAWFEHVDRGERMNDIHIHFLTVERGWAWQIPISERVTSIGVVAEKQVFQRSNRQYDEWFAELIKSAPDIEYAMREAIRINDFTVEADYSYSMERFVGDGYMLIGDAARFVDPIFSSGVSVALYSAKFAVEQILNVRESGAFLISDLQPYEDRLKMGTHIWYEFICLYYKLLPLFTKFIESKEYRLQVLQLLQGDVYDREDVPVLNAMREYIKAVEANDNHLLRGAMDESLPIDTS